MSWFHRRVPGWAVGLAGYGLAAVLLFWPAWLSPAERTVGGRGDPFFFMWFLRWFPYAVAHGWNPLFTTHLDYPDGVNLMWNTSIALPSLLLTPVTLTAGPVVAYNLLVTLGLALSGWCAYLALRRYVRSGAAAFVGGAIYAFSPFMVSQSLGHPHLTMAWAPPLILLILDEMLVRQRVSRWHGVLLGGLGAAQLVTGEELLAMVAVAGVIGLATLAVLQPHAAWARLRPALPVFGTALGTFLLLAGLPLGVQFLGPQQVHGTLQPHNYYVTDVLNFVVPTRMLLAAPALATHVSDHFAGNVSEQTGYLGVPLLALLVVRVRRSWRQPVVAWAVITGSVLAILSLGGTLHVAGSDTGIPLPWALLDRVPLVREILPARLSLVMFLLVGLLVAVFLDAALAKTGWRLRTGGIAVTVLALAALIPTLPYPASSVTAPTFFSRPLGLRTLPEGTVVLVAPFAVVGSADAMYWQGAAGMWFRMPEGEAFVPGPDPLYPPRSATELALVPLAYRTDPPALDPQVATQIRMDLRRWSVAAVVVGPMPHHDEAVALMTRVLGQRPAQDEGVEVWWNVPAALAQADR